MISRVKKENSRKVQNVTELFLKTLIIKKNLSQWNLSLLKD